MKSVMIEMFNRLFRELARLCKDIFRPLFLVIMRSGLTTLKFLSTLVELMVSKESKLTMLRITTEKSS